MGITVTGSFDNTERFLKAMSKLDIPKIVRSQCQAGVAKLASATPEDTGRAAHSWSYEIVDKKGGCDIYWTNSDVEDGYPVIIGIQYGHGTGTGGYVQGQDFINPAIRPIFDQIANDVWRAVTSA